MYKEKWLVDLDTIQSISTKEENIICLLGTEEAPKFAVVCINVGDDWWKVRAEDEEGNVFRESKVLTENLDFSVRQMVNSLKTMYFYDDMWEGGEEEDEEEYYCNNPNCKRYGLIFGDYDYVGNKPICPSCGMPVVSLDDYEFNDDIYDYKEIAHLLLAFIMEMCSAIKISKEEIYDALSEFGLSRDEIEML